MVRRKNKDLQFILGIVTGIGIMIALFVTIVIIDENRYGNYEHKGFHFKLDVPATWTIRENSDGAAAIFITKPEGALDIFVENVNVVVEDISKLPQPDNLREYTKQAIFQMKATFKDYLQVEESEETIWAGQKAHKFVFTTGVEQLKLKFFILWTLDGNLAYQFTYTASESGYDKYFDRVQRMARTFTIRKIEN